MSIYESRLSKILSEVQQFPDLGLLHCGRISRAVGLTLEAKGFNQPVGARCLIQVAHNHTIEACI